MTDESATPYLGEFDDLDVVETGVAIRSAASALAASLKVDPVVLRTGDEVDLILRCKVGKIAHEPMYSGVAFIGFRRVSELNPSLATIAKDDTIDALLAAQATRIDHAQQVEGQTSLDDYDQ